jgi:alkylation response protein AidB-like acyl-CoA dehydrogenase
MVIAEALGAALVVEPFLESAVLGAGLLKRAKGAEALLMRVAKGESRVAFCWAEAEQRYAADRPATRAEKAPGGWILHGRKSGVGAAPLATHLIVSADAGAEGLSLFVIEPPRAGVEMTAYRTIDDRHAADVVLSGAVLPAASKLEIAGDAAGLIDQVLDEYAAAACAEAVGCMRVLVDDTVAYAKQRQQFGHPIAAFQVLQHRMVDMYLALQQANAAAHLATLKLSASAAERQRAVSAAKIVINTSARFIAQSAVQIHGGMGMTDELRVGHYFKRLTAIEHALGDSDHHLARYLGARARAGG